MALGQPLALAALISEGLRKSQDSRVPVRPVRHQLNSLCNRGGILLCQRHFHLTYPVSATHEYPSCSCWPISLAAAKHRPNDPRILVHQRHRGDVLVAPGDQPLNLFTAAGLGPIAVGFILAGIYHRPSVDQ